MIVYMMNKKKEDIFPRGGAVPAFQRVASHVFDRFFSPFLVSPRQQGYPVCFPASGSTVLYCRQVDPVTGQWCDLWLI